MERKIVGEMLSLENLSGICDENTLEFSGNSIELHENSEPLEEKITEFTGKSFH